MSNGKALRTGLWLWLIGTILLFWRDEGEARLASQLSLAVGEEFTDNVFFSVKKRPDVISTLTPTLRLIYQPTATSLSKLTMNINAPVELFANHSNLNNVGDRLSMWTRFLYPHSRRLLFEFTHCVGRLGQARNARFGNVKGSSATRLGGEGSILGDLGSSRGQQQMDGCGGTGGFSVSRTTDTQSFSNERELVTQGAVLRNSVYGSSTFLVTPSFRVKGAYRWNYMAFIDAGGTETSQGAEVHASYDVWHQHTVQARYRVEFLRSRTGKRHTIHDFDIGDRFFSSRQIQLTPTLTLSGRMGLSFATEKKGLRLEHKLEANLRKMWRTAALEVDIRRGLTESFGVGGPSLTTKFLTHFTIALSRRWHAFLAAEYSMFDTGQDEFDTFVAGLGVQYQVFPWLSVSVAYAYRRLDPRGTLVRSPLSLHGNTDSNTLFITFVSTFDLWPTPGLGKSFERFENVPSAFSSPTL